MCRLSIITINFNNAIGLDKTLKSVLSQTSTDYEYIVVDGGSNDTSCQVIRDKRLELNGVAEVNGIKVTCISEPDNGIYHAMNKGIRMAKGEYVQFLNSGDCLVDEHVVEKMLFQLQVTSYKLEEKTRKDSRFKIQVSILYGNMLKQMPKGLLKDKGFAGRQPTMLDFYTGTLNHSPAYIKRSLFDDFGLYDESLKIVSDWKWYLQSIVFGDTVLTYVDIDVSIFDMNGISTVNTILEKKERSEVLDSLLPKNVLLDYGKYSIYIRQIERIQRYKIVSKFFWFTERLLFKYEKRNSFKIK